MPAKHKVEREKKNVGEWNEIGENNWE